MSSIKPNISGGFSLTAPNGGTWYFEATATTEERNITYYVRGTPICFMVSYVELTASVDSLDYLYLNAIKAIKMATREL